MMNIDSNYEVVTKLTEAKQSAQLQIGQQAKIRISHGGVMVPHKVTIGNGEIRTEVQRILLQMSPGDQWIVENQTGRLNIAVDEAGIIVDLMTGVQLADKLKSEGNLRMKEKDYAAASAAYTSAYRYIQFDCTPQGVQLRLTILSNLALACLSAGNFEDALKWCTQRIECSLQPNPKIVYRQATANKSLGNYVQARDNISFGLELSQDDSESAQLFKALREQVDKEENLNLKKQKEVYRNMFS